MCGIWALCFSDGSVSSVDYDYFKKLEHRGPDDSVWLSHPNMPFHFGFHRLSIQDLSEAGRQPFVRQNESYYESWMCNGEIYNAEEIKKKLVFQKWSGHSDCEVIGPWLHRLIEKPTLNIGELMDQFDGVYAGVYLYWDYYTGSGVFMAFRDPIGVRPLFWGQSPDGRLYFASEAKTIPLAERFINPFPQGSLWICPIKKLPFQLPVSQYQEPHLPALFPTMNGSRGYYWGNPLKNAPKTEDISQQHLVKLLEDAVEKRLLSDRPIASLLSGGLDSSLIAAIAARKLGERGQKLSTFSIGFEGAPDLIAAREVAEHIGSDHHEIIITPEEALEVIPEVVRTLETWDPTTIRASTGMYLASRYIREKTDFVVVLSGEGADELMEGYLYFHRAPTPEQGALDSERLVLELPWYDVLRADKTTAAHGLELRVPFLDKEFVRYAMHLPAEIRSPRTIRGVEKGYMRQAFEELRGDLLPHSILWRKKEAFSDGISVPKHSWFAIIQEHASKQYISDDLAAVQLSYMSDYYGEEELEVESVRQRRAMNTIEARWFMTLFSGNYRNGGQHWIPHVWLPRWSATIDPSARTLEQNENLSK